MSKRFTAAYIIFSFIVFSLLIVWFVFRGINTRNVNTEAAREELDQLTQTVSSSYLAGGSFTSPYFRESMLERIHTSDRIRVAIVMSGKQEIVFLYAVSGEYLPGDTSPSNNIAIPYEISFSRLSERRISASVPIPDLPDVAIDAVFNIFGRDEVYPIVRELLVGLLSFLLLTAILIIAQPRFARKSSESPDGVPSAQADDPPSITEEQEPPVAPESNDEPNDEPIVDYNGLYSPETNLGKAEHLEERLSAELKRAAAFDQDLVLLLASISGLRMHNPIFNEFSQIAREFFNFQDLCFEYGRASIGIIIPNVDIDQGIERVEAFKSRVEKLIVSKGLNGHLVAGLSARNGRLISGNRIITEAKSAFRRSAKFPGDIIAFRVDPEKYRSYIASKKSTIT